MSTKDAPLSVTDIKTNLGEVQAKMAELQSSLTALENSLDRLTHEAESATETLGLKGIARFANKLSSAATQDKILQGILEATRDFVDRGAFFLEFESGYHSWKGFGFATEALENLHISDPQDPVVIAARDRSLIQVEGDLGQKVNWLASGSAVARNAVCIPLVFKDTVPIVFYGDSQGTIKVAPLELLLQISVLVLQNHYLTHLVQQKSEPVSSRWPVLEQTKQEASPEPPASTSAALPPDEIPTDEPPIDTAAFGDGDRGEEELHEEILVDEEIREAWSPEVLPEETPSPDEVTEQEVPGIGEEEAEQVPEMVAGALEESERPEDIGVETSATPEEGYLPVEEALLAEPQETVTEEHAEEHEPVGPDAEEEPQVVELTQEEEEHAHSEARRFARLLVTEIRLYNEDAVEQGRDANNLYSRLKADIDRSREMYAKRAHPLIQEKIDYFHEQLLTILALEEPSKMGPDYPGAQFKESDHSLS